MIRRHIGPGFELPAATAQIYQLAEVKVRLTDAKLIFRVSIPILRAAVFQIWRIIPIPQAMNGIFVEILPSAVFLFGEPREHNVL